MMADLSRHVITRRIAGRRPSAFDPKRLVSVVSYGVIACFVRSNDGARLKRVGAPIRSAVVSPRRISVAKAREVTTPIAVIVIRLRPEHTRIDLQFAGSSR